MNREDSPRHFPGVAAFRLMMLVGWTAFMIPIHGTALLLRLRLSARTLRFYWKGICWFAGIRVVTHGTMTEKSPVLFVANHISYFDIAVLGRTLLASFIAKSEVARWPALGILSKLGRTLFIVRQRGRSAEQRDEILERMKRNDSLIVFPEGTSSDGNRVLPFKSALFSVAETRIDDAPVLVQPVSVAYTRLDGLPVCYEWRSFFAWYGDMELASHVWNMLGLAGTVDVDVIFHAPVSMSDFSSRKEMAAYCHTCIADAVSLANGGRLGEGGEKK